MTPSSTPAGATLHARPEAPAAGNRRGTLSRHDAMARRRIRFLMLIIALVMLGYAGRLTQLQVVRGDELARTGVDQRLTTVFLPATRGTISDSDGQPLAVSVDAVDVTADQTMVVDPAATAAALAPLLRVQPAGVEALLTGTKRYVLVAGRVDPATWRRIADLGLAGVYGERTTKRVYPAGDLAANVIGFVGVDGHGLDGLEYGLDTELAGTDGKRVFERAPGGRILPTGIAELVEPVAGTGVRLTIDRDIQWVAQRVLAERVAFAEADSGTVVVMDPTNGHILALASVPTFDSNRPTATSVADRANRAVTTVFEPGSTAKVMALAAVLEEGLATPTSRFTVPDRLAWPTKTFRDHDDHPPLKLTLTGILARSSNVGTIMAAEDLPHATLHDYYARFGIGQSTGLRFPGESKGVLPKPGTAAWSATTFPTLTFGQGFSVNAVQAAGVYAAIANDGVRVRPTLIKSYVGNDGSVQTATAPESVRVISAETARALRHMLERVVSSEGTGTKASIPGYRVAGKTATAQRYDPRCGCYNGYVASFIGMVPAEAPRLVIAVTLDNPRNGHYGGALGGPAFAQIATYALQDLRVAPSEADAPDLPTTWK